MSLRSFTENPTVAVVLGALIISVSVVIGNSVSEGGIVHLLGGLTAKDIEDGKLLKISIMTTNSRFDQAPTRDESTPAECPQGWINASGDGPAKNSKQYIVADLPPKGYVYRVCYQIRRDRGSKTGNVAERIADV